LIKSLESALQGARTLDIEIPHQNLWIQGDSVAIDTSDKDDTALQSLYELINAYKDPKLRNSLLTQLQQERPAFKLKIKVRHFLQHVAYGNQKEAECLLRHDAEEAQELLTASTFPFTDYSGRTFCCTAYEYAWWAKDDISYNQGERLPFFVQDAPNTAVP
jgi:hypothetical protein